MAQFDIRRNPSPRSRASTPYVLIVQCDLLADLEPVAVVPLRRKDTLGPPIRRLNPSFTVDGVEVVMMPNAIAGVSKRDLGEVVANLAEHRHDIIAALDFLLTSV
ncbi:CcdB family protein [Roseomonas genomospecies 6]|uniref:Toxin CcdB n=1 Tax=Roseomonas genomospecies 6 TaxID=214106 RepID=A0A9W7NNZ7_9PROT|nr:CcdB family protein [Roseomonas genomospecies 6]KAA0684158.1 plasmid maintenance protein CcdB [Roseomonas genomospecies 6]